MTDFIILSSTLFAIIISIIFIKEILSYEAGTKEMLEISTLIEKCSKTYLKKQYTIVFLVALVISIFIIIFLNKYYFLGFILGSFLSALAGYIGMTISVKANVRTTNAVRLYDINKGLNIAIKAGSITGLLVVSFSILSIFIFYKTLILIKLENKIILNTLISLAFGASLISVFARLGGGIFTKAADIGADLIGKLELGITEDDPRNPAVIADNIGDNVGDCAGMAADIYETHCVTNIASMVLISIILKDNSNDFLMLPLTLNSITIIGSIFGIFFIKTKNDKIINALYKGFLSSSLISICLNYIYIFFIFNTNKINEIINVEKIFYCYTLGIFLTILLFFITEYYTSYKYKPVKSIAYASKKGHAPNIIQGLAVSMESTTMPVISIIIVLLTSYKILDLLGIAIAAIGMISLSGIIITFDAYGPVTDNAGGIAEMAKLNEDVRKKTDKLDAVGNITKAVTKGYAIGSAGLSSIILFIVYTEDLNFYFNNLILSFSLKDPFVISGLFLGGSIPYIFSSLSIKAVSNVADKVLNEVKKQFEELRIIETNSKPNYDKVIELLTKESIKEMIIPSILPIFIPLISYGIISLIFNKENSFIFLGSLLLGTILVGLFLAIKMTSGGGAWDNAKKYIENGNIDGKNSLTHKASITGDMVGDPYKDTAGPAINPLIKVINIIALLLLMFLSKI